MPGVTPNKPQRIFITGASGGLGMALARLYAARGAVLGLVARRAEALQALQRDTQKISMKTYSYVADVRDAAQIAEAARAFISETGCPDVVIANAGVSVGTLTEHAEDAAAFRTVMETNLLGALHTFQPFVPVMKTAGRGTLVGIASIAGYRGLPGAGAYSASKAALISYLESLRVELRPAGVKVITICPGYIETPMTEKNPYTMPFMMSAEDAAQKIASIVARGKTYAVIPWQMAVVARVMRLLPNAPYDRIAQHGPRKPRQN